MSSFPSKDDNFTGALLLKLIELIVKNFKFSGFAT